MANVDLSDQAVRSRIIQEIQGEENVSRKRNAQRDFDVYNGRQDRYILEKLECEFTNQTLDQMRTVLSISLSKRIVDSKASVYTAEPERIFLDVSEAEDQHLRELYFTAMANGNLLVTNRYMKMSAQTALMVIPKDGMIMFKPLHLKDYDVVPDRDNPEKAFAYILNVWDLDLRKSYRTNPYTNDERRYFQNDVMNQKIGDVNDRKKVQDKYVVWTDDFHFTMDGKGNIISEVVENPIGMLPFIDVPSQNKDHEFFVRQGSNHTEFSLDWAVAMSDVGNVVKFQNYSQPIISSDKMPVELAVGPNRTLWLELDPDRPELKPSFEFASPSPDIGGSLAYVDQLLVSFLTSEGLDPSLVSQNKDVTKFSSGIERHLAMIDRFEASREDFDIFNRVEDQLLELTKRWNNVLQGVRDPETGEPMLKESLQGPIINENAKVEVKFASPESIQTERELEDSVIRLMETGLMSRKEAIMKLRNVDEESAAEIIAEIDDDEADPELNPPANAPVMNQPFVEEDQGEGDGEDAQGDQA